jgi:hypothetical protein
MSAAALIQEIEREIDRALLLDMPGDKCAMFLSGSYVFLTGDNSPGTITMVVPADSDFYGQRLNLYLGSRLIDQGDLTGLGTDLTFRPAAWVSINNAEDINNNYAVQDANASWNLSDTYNGSYQGNTPLNIAACYSGQYGQGSVHAQVPLSAWPGGRDFFIPRKIRRGSTVTINITPTFSRVQNETVKTQFRVVGVMTGYKVVRRPT